MSINLYKCTIKNCDRKADGAFGLCRAHYERYKKGKRGKRLRRPIRSKTKQKGLKCKWPGCFEPAVAIGFCNKHKMAYYRINKIMKLKERLFNKQNRICTGCDTPFLYARHLHLDHIKPKSKGGTNKTSNLQLLCASCNTIKSNKLDMDELRAYNEDRGLMHYE